MAAAATNDDDIIVSSNVVMDDIAGQPSQPQEQDNETADDEDAADISSAGNCFKILILYCFCVFVHSFFNMNEKKMHIQFGKLLKITEIIYIVGKNKTRRGTMMKKAPAERQRSAKTPALLASKGAAGRPLTAVGQPMPSVDWVIAIDAHLKSSSAAGSRTTANKMRASSASRPASSSRSHLEEQQRRDDSPASTSRQLRHHRQQRQITNADKGPAAAARTTDVGAAAHRLLSSSVSQHPSPAAVPCKPRKEPTAASNKQKNLGGRPQGDGIGRYASEQYRREEIEFGLFRDTTFIATPAAAAALRPAGSKRTTCSSNKSSNTTKTSIINEEATSEVARLVVDDMYRHLTGGLIIPEGAGMDYNGIVHIISSIQFIHL